MADDEERTVRYLHEATQGEEGADGKKEFSCKWFLDRSFFCVSKYCGCATELLNVVSAGNV